jgi:hypothetical protein
LEGDRHEGVKLIEFPLRIPKSAHQNLRENSASATAVDLKIEYEKKA